MALGLAAAMASCGGEGLVVPPGEPSSIAVVAGDGQIDTVGHLLSDSLVVRVTDPQDRPVPGVEVAFVAPADGVLAPNDTVLTDADGQAAVQYKLSTAAGDQLIRAQARSAVPLPSLNTALHATALPEAASALVVAGGNEQTGEAGAALPDSLAVKAVDRFGNGVPGIEVTWEANRGTVSPASVVTGADGRAATERTLGDRPGAYPTTAAAADLEGSPVSFTASGVAAPSPRLIVTTQPASTASAGVPFTRQPVLQLQTAAGTPLHRADVAVTVQIASGGGSLGGSVTARSDDEGVVTFEELSIRGKPGVRILIFAASDFTSAVSTEIDVGRGPPLPSASSASVPNGTAGVPTEITVRLEDAFGTPVEGAARDISITIDGANPASGLEVEDRGAGSYSASYVPIRSGTDNVAVVVNGTPVSGSPLVSVVVPGPADASTTTATITEVGVFFTQFDILVTTRDAQGNLIGRGGEQVQIQVNSGPLRTAVDNGDGTYSDSFVTIGSRPTIAITLNGVPISGNPF
jgi:hypothetical protein